ncbi:MAG: alpha/beta hydrolase fold domain-containing protein [Thermomicrobiales bacterium]
MPIGYFIPVVLIAWCTYFVLAPQSWPRVFGSLGFYFGVVNECPFLALFWILGSTGLALAQGDVNSPLGWVAFGLTVATVVGLMVIIWRGIQTASVVGRALDSGLGSGWRAAIDPKVAPRLRSKFTFRALLGPLFVRRPSVERLANLRYGDAGASNLLDLYRHKSRPVDCPVLIHIHSGALTGGKKNREALPLIYRLVSQGWVCISANYRLSPAATFPDHLVDVKQVIAWVRTHGREYGADPELVFVAGGSSGAQLAALAALTPNNAKLQPGFETANTSVCAAITLYGDYDWLDTRGAWSALGIDRTGSQQPIMKSSPVENREAWLQASPLAQIREDAPPFFVVHGDRDTALPVVAARSFADQLRGVSQCPVVYAELPGALHNFDQFQSLRAEAVIDGIEAFAGWVRTNSKLHFSLKSSLSRAN